MLDFLTNLRFMITLSYALFTVIVYTIVSFIIFTQKEHFNGSFFRIFISGYFMNLWTYGNSFITIRLPQITQLNGSFSEFFLSHGLENVEINIFPLNLFYMLHYHFAYSQYLFNLLTSLNRATAVFWPWKVEIIWHNIIWPGILIVFISPFVFTYPIFFANAYYVYDPNGRYFQTITQYDRAKIYSSLMPFLISCTIVNIVVSISAFKKFIEINKSGGKVKESNLFCMAMIIFFIEVTVSILTIFNYLASNKMNWLLVVFSEMQIANLTYMVQIFIPFGSDLMTFSHPWLLLIFSKSVRKRVLKKLHLKNTSDILRRKLHMFSTSNSSVEGAEHRSEMASVRNQVRHPAGRRIVATAPIMI